MKKVLTCIINKFVFLSLAMIYAVGSFAQDDQFRSVYDVPQSKNHVELYSGYFPVMVFGVVIVFLGYLGYRYWRDNMYDERPDDNIGHEPHHQ